MTWQQRLNVRLAAIEESATRLTSAVDRNIAQCETCRKTVIGNGQPPLSNRVTAVETQLSERRDIGKRDLAIIATVSGLIGAFGSPLVSRLFGG
jgi:hypothetical protein